MSDLFVKDKSGVYTPQKNGYTHDELVAFAIKLVGYKFRKRVFLDSPDAVRRYLELHFTDREREHFWTVFLDNRHRVLRHEILFSGTIDSASIYPRVVVQKSLECNAAAIIMAHNHPSGVAEPSRSDIEITKKINAAIKCVDIRLLDHLIIGGGKTVSLAERGEI